MRPKLQAAADRLCERLAGGESLRTICKDPDMPAFRTVMRWLTEEGNDAFRHQYAHAREVQAHAMAEEIIEIANTPVIGTQTKTKDGEIETTEADMLGHRKLQIDARKWYLSKVLPRVYGDKLDLTHSGSLRVVQVTELTSPEERDAAWQKPKP